MARGCPWPTNKHSYRCFAILLAVTIALGRHVVSAAPAKVQSAPVQGGQHKQNNNLFRRKQEKSSADTTKSTGSYKATKSSAKREPTGSKRKSHEPKTYPKGVRKRTSLPKSAGNPPVEIAHSIRASQDLMSLLANVDSNRSCALNDSGSYGDIFKAHADGGKSYVIEFNYQTSVVQGSTPVEISQTVVPDVDRAVASSILPNFFACIPGNNRRSLQSGAIEALSSLPIDKFVSKRLSCPKEIQSTDCYIARGAVTVVAKDVFNVGALTDLMKAAVRSAFESGAVLENISTDLVRDTSFLADGLQFTQDTSPTITFSPVPPLLTAAPVPSPSALSTPSTPLPTFFVTPTNIPSTTQPTMGQSSPLAQPTATPSSATIAPSSVPPNRTSTQAPSAFAPEEKKSRSLWWVWVIVAVVGVLLFVFLLTLCEDVDKSAVHPNGKKKTRSEDADERFGSAYVPPTDAAKAAAAHLRRERSNAALQTTTTSASASDQRGTTFGVDSERSEEHREGNGDNEGRDGFYMDDLVEIVEEEEEVDERGDGEESMYSEEEVSVGGGTWTEAQEASYGTGSSYT